MKQRVYIDTSVIGGCFDEEFSEWSLGLFKRFEKNEIIFMISDLIEFELVKSPLHVRQHFHKYSKSNFEKISLTKEAMQLADKYIMEKVIGASSIDDCRHIAMATIAKADVLASWNFKHVVNLKRIKGYNFVNLQMGYPLLEIRSPKDLMYGE